MLLTIGLLTGGNNGHQQLDRNFNASGTGNSSTHSPTLETVDVAPIWWSLSGSIRTSRPTSKLEKPTVQLPLPSPIRQLQADPVELGYARSIICAPETRWPCDWAMALVDCESSFQTSVVGSEIYRGQRWYFYGWFQIASLIPPDAPNAPTFLFDPIRNTQEGHWKFMNGGTGNWPNCP